MDRGPTSPPQGRPRMPSCPHPQYQDGLHFTRGRQLLAPAVFDCALEVLLAAPGQLYREEPG